MTNNDAYTLGYIYAKLERELPESEQDKTGFRLSQAGQNPLAGFADINVRAIRARVMTDELARDVTDALATLDPSVNGTAEHISLPLQGSWHLGYYACLAGKPLSVTSPKDEIATIRRKLSMSQTALAKAIDADPSEVSRWETGKISPRPETMEKIRELLNGKDAQNERAVQEF